MVTQNIGDPEDLGRCCFESKESGRRNPRVRFLRRSFVGGAMSVDRLESADSWSLCNLHDLEGSRRTPPRDFYGWYVFTAALVRSVEWCVVSEPTPENPWHAEVHRQLGTTEQEDHFLQDCNKVASQARWSARLIGPESARPIKADDEEFLENVSRRLR